MLRKLPRRLGFFAIFGSNRYLAPFNRGIATPVCGLVRNDRKLEGEAAKHQFAAASDASLQDGIPSCVFCEIIDFFHNLCNNSLVII